MIKRFRTVVPGKLYRGSAPDPLDVAKLHKLGIKKIVSLDKETGDKIDRACKLLNIEHVKLYIRTDNIKDQKHDLLNLVSQDLKKVFLEGGPTLVHCLQGKDRAGLVSALIKCRYFGVSPKDAIKEAKSLGFGKFVPPEIVHLYEKIINSCQPIKDANSADIVSNNRERVSDNRSSFLDEAFQHSFAPYLDPNRTDAPYISINDQDMTRQNYTTEKETQSDDSKETGVFPDVGVFNNDSGLMAAGPTLNQTGFVYASEME
jgi:protein tyrosine/serine phosphatase